MRLPWSVGQVRFGESADLPGALRKGDPDRDRRASEEEPEELGGAL